MLDAIIGSNQSKPPASPPPQQGAKSSANETPASNQSSASGQTSDADEAIQKEDDGTYTTVTASGESSAGEAEASQETPADSTPAASANTTDANAPASTGDGATQAETAEPGQGDNEPTSKSDDASPANGSAQGEGEATEAPDEASSEAGNAAGSDTADASYGAGAASQMPDANTSNSGGADKSAVVTGGNGQDGRAKYGASRSQTNSDDTWPIEAYDAGPPVVGNHSAALHARLQEIHSTVANKAAPASSSRERALANIQNKVVMQLLDRLAGPASPGNDLLSDDHVRELKVSSASALFAQP